MRVNILVILLLFFGASGVVAEVIESVSFNPSRFGQYERLTVSEEVDAKGGLSTTNLNVSSAGTVDMNVQRPLDDNTAYYFPTVDAVEGNGVRLSNACFSESGTDCRAYDASLEPDAGKVGNLVISSKDGGREIEPDTAVFLNDSFINSVSTAVDTLKVKAGQIQLGRLTVQGGGGVTYSGDALMGVKLAGNDIPQPTQGNTVEKDGVTSKDLNNCEMVWDERRSVEKDGKYNTYKVLALKNCKKEVDVCEQNPIPYGSLCGCSIKHPELSFNEEQRFMLCQTCPPYMSNHQAECCVVRGGTWNSPSPGCWSKTYSYSQSGSYACGYPCLLYDGHCGVAMSERRSQGCRPDGGRVCPSNNSCTASEVGQECYYCVTRKRTDIDPKVCSHSTYVYSKICAASDRRLF